MCNIGGIDIASRKFATTVSSTRMEQAFPKAAAK